MNYRPDERYPENWNSLRHFIFNRDGNRCVICGSAINLHCHHIVPIGLGGSNSPKNLVTLCDYCHSLIHDEKMYWLNDILKSYIEDIYDL